jgi:hypothetical protein
MSAWVETLAMAAIDRMTGTEIVAALAILVAGFSLAVLVPSPIHDFLAARLPWTKKKKRGRR